MKKKTKKEKKAKIGRAWFETKEKKTIFERGNDHQTRQRTINYLKQLLFVIYSILIKKNELLKSSAN